MDVWSGGRKTALRLTALAWCLSTIVFYVWWFLPGHVGSVFGFAVTTIIISWPLVLFGYCFFFLLKMKKPDHTHPIPKGLKVAMIVTKAPSEPLAVVQDTLLGALNQAYPHDTWVADEDPTSEALEWYARHNVYVSTRKHVSEYHSDSWPRRKKSKEGNLAYFYDTYGYDRYDVVVQVDADHIPQESYLEHMLRPFGNPAVGYVAAPSVCDLNTHVSWSARARMHAEAIFHGPIQSGSNDGWVPICIGSHYAVRTSALREIGGIGPELAEDYSTTLLFNAAGWRGVWVYDAEAKGEGPNSFADVIVQDYQWARSLVTIFLTLFPRVFKKLNIRQKIQFTLTQLWYPMGAFIWFASMLIMIAALVSGKAPVVVSFPQFLLYSVLPYILAFATFMAVRWEGHMRPEHGNFLTWENFLFEFARWPWVAIACVDAVYSLIISRGHTYRVTSKSKPSQEKMPLPYLLPYLTTAIALMFSLVFSRNPDVTFGYYIFAAVIAAIYLVLSVIVLVLHLIEVEHENKLKLTIDHSPHLVSSLGIAALFVLVVGVTLNQYAIFYELGRTRHIEVAHNAQTTLLTDGVGRANADIATSTPAASMQTIDYTVQDGESLWRIARRYYGSGFEWVKIYKANTDKVSYPDLIDPGQVLSLPDVPVRH